jgi:hypothetical protein
MKRKSVLVLAMVAVASVARSGHELPVYPSYYPHEIEIATLPPERAAAMLAEGKLQAYVGEPPKFAGPPPEAVQTIGSLGAFFVVRANPAATDPAACVAVRAVAADLSARGGDFVFHPYPVTPLHGDFLHYSDLAETAKARLLEEKADLESLQLKVRADGDLARTLVRRAWVVRSGEWDAEVIEIAAAGLIASTSFAINGWLGPPWLKEGWFQAFLLLGASVSDPAAKQRIESDVKALQENASADLAERANRERDLVSALRADCRVVVAGYSLKREYFSAEFSNGIENIGYDSIAGMNSAIFLRTVKLKDFPWNGWLALGIAAPPTAAWNPIAGFNDPFGRLLWSAVGDPVLLPSPNDSAWLLNRASDVEAAPTLKAE